jgi:hypothetical protein
MSLRHFALVLAALLPSVLPAAEVPRWVLAGILHIESRSYFTTTGIVYVDQRTGAAGELGPFQMTRDAFDLVARTGEEFERLKRDTAFAQDLCERYLRLLWSDFSDRDWFIATGRWNVGPHGSYKGAWRYAKTAQQAGGGQ